MKKLSALLAVAAASALALGACVVPSTPVRPSKPAKPVNAAVDPKLREYYTQKLQWKPCRERNFECAEMQVPLDYAKPDGSHAQIALKRRESNDPAKRLGTLVMNPGGPGGSGLDSLSSDNLGYFFTPEVREYYSILSFDPRGVGASKPTIKCRTPQQLDADNAAYYDVLTPEGRKQALAETKRLGQECQAGSPEMIRYASTENTARDLDILRAVVGDERLNYLGYSYGTYLGAIYADLFPNRVGRFVLDGVLDPTSNINEVAALQAGGFEASLREFSKQCQKYHADECPLHGGEAAGMKQIRALLATLVTTPMPTDDPSRQLTVSLALTGMIGSMYNSYSWWQTLMPALDQAMNHNDGTQLLSSADFYNSRNADGTYKDNSTDAFIVINSLDYTPVGDQASWDQDAAKLMKDCPTLGRFFVYSSMGADLWPVPGDPKAKRQVNPKTRDNILLVGSTGDPATPYAMANHVRKMMTRSRLLTLESWDHTSYNSMAPKCISKTVDDYLISGQLPDSLQSGLCSIE